MTKPKQNTLFVGSLAKGLRILRAFDETRTEMSLGALADATGLDKSAVQRLANTLHIEGMLDKDPVTRRYRPSHAWLRLAYAYYWSDPLVARAMPKLIDLSQRLGETVNLAELSGEHIIYAARLPCTRTIFAASVPGRQVPALITSAGQTILATYPEDMRAAAIRDWHIAPHTPQTTLDRAVIADQVEAARRAGYAITHSQMIHGEVGIACAIRGPDGRAWAAVHCSVSAHHWDDTRIRAEILPWLQDTANAISPQMRG
ncbi:IclR family transcriptional regulator [Roseovarius nanhaiticus]|uniref:Transcriptional regulator, IclR family n=1 Tax=Roseovarius nanhaiticus TaxID=573024 RepID=A0A1N7HLF4_9RHOB|nr:IclR family transcriptional regulator [Roseovarius nanhaiticus]SEL28040.1 transcriptional regulator, IclR family [Roseovarius nanhaiticus]SIS25686.1 transcriptional regulator, IclR family [Roseovarius nanhaiticus]